MFLIHVVLGFMLLLILGFMWVGAERNGWCSSSWDYESIQECISGEATAHGLRIFRLMTPILVIAWLIIGSTLIRQRQLGSFTVLGSLITLGTTFCLMVYLG